ncbi:MAG: histidine kinase dimerization/phospho-acceptor domain-containing protein [Candidatus Omnitrophota bacterium]
MCSFSPLTSFILLGILFVVAFVAMRSVAEITARSRDSENLLQERIKSVREENITDSGTLFSDINHEICTPLGIIRGQCEMFLLNIRDGIYRDKDPKELLGKSMEIMEMVIRETDRASAITKKLCLRDKPVSGISRENEDSYPRT